MEMFLLPTFNVLVISEYKIKYGKYDIFVVIMDCFETLAAQCSDV